MNAPNPAPKRKRGVLLALFVIVGAIVMAALMLAFVGLVLGREAVEGIGRTARSARPFAALLWAGVIYLAARFHWETIVDWLIARSAVAASARQTVLDARWRIATLFWVIDLTVVAGFPFWMS